MAFTRRMVKNSHIKPVDKETERMIRKLQDERSRHYLNDELTDEEVEKKAKEINKKIESLIK